MSTENQINKLEERLSDLSKQCREQKRTAKARLHDSDTAIHNLLRNGIATVQTLIDSPLLAIGDNATLTPKHGTVITATPVTVAQACDEACTAFKDLAEAADRYLKDIMAMQLAVIEFEGELVMLEKDMNAVAAKTLDAILEVETSLTAKERELREAQEELESSTRDMEALVDKLESNRDKRHLLRVGRAAAWIATPFFPPVAGVALVLEAGNLKLKDDKACLKSRIGDASETKQKLNHSLAELRLNQEIFQGDLVKNESALERCRVLVDGIDSSKIALARHEADYQNLKEAAGKFSLWTGELDSQALLLGDSDDNHGIGQATKLLVDELANFQGGSVKLICDSLRPAPKPVPRKAVDADPFSCIKISMRLML